MLVGKKSKLLSPLCTCLNLFINAGDAKYCLEELQISESYDNKTTRVVWLEVVL